MKFQVIYFSKTGNTKKVAEAVASELGIKAEPVKEAKLNKDGLIFLGSGNYGGKPAKIMTRFIEDNNFKSRNIFLFGTSGGGQGIEVQEMENMLNNKNAIIKGKFFCKGRIFLINLGRPNDRDLDEAKRYAKHMIK